MKKLLLITLMMLLQISTQAEQKLKWSIAGGVLLLHSLLFAQGIYKHNEFVVPNVTKEFKKEIKNEESFEKKIRMKEFITNIYQNQTFFWLKDNYNNTEWDKIIDNLQTKLPNSRYVPCIGLGVLGVFLVCIDRIRA